MQTRSPRILAVLACGIALSLALFRVFAAEPEYELSQATSVDVAGVATQMPAGQAVTVIGSTTPDQSGNIMVKITLANGSVTLVQIPATSIRVKGSAVAVAAAPTDGGVPPAAASTGGAPPPPAASMAPLTPTTPPAALTQTSPTAPAPATQPATTTTAPATGGNDAQSKYNAEGGGGGGEHTDWKLVWEDDFSKDGGKIDPNKWSFQINGKGGGNGEQEYYTDSPSNAHIENGELVMTAIKDDQGHKFTSAKLWTKGKYEVQYGRIEACIKAPKAQKGNWPAFWLMPHEPSPYGGWPNCGEIDIMEVINMEDKLYGTDHFGTGRKQAGVQIAAPNGNFSTDYHVYGVEWEPKKFTWFLDHKSYGSITDWGTPKGPFPAPFDQKFYIILNYAVGGAWPKNPDATSTYPQSMFVKYVRVYQPQ
jgi:beta-glucanase (GH16 family)